MQVNTGQQNPDQIVHIKKVAMGLWVSGLQPIEVASAASASAKVTISNLCSITKMPSMLGIVKSNAFSKARGTVSERLDNNHQSIHKCDSDSKNTKSNCEHIFL